MKLSLCIIGCDSWARTVLEEIRDMREELQLFFACRDTQKAEEYCETYKGEGFFGSYEAAASDPRVQAIYFITPHHLRVKNVKLAVQNSKHVLVGNPISLSMDESTDVMRSAKDAGIKLMVAENYRFLPVVEKCKQIIERGYIGNLRLIQIQIERYVTPKDWKNESNMFGGGEFVDTGIHIVDILLNLGGLPSRIYAARPPQIFREMEAEDGMLMTAHMKGGAIGLINCSRASSFNKQRWWVSVTGSKGCITFDIRKNEVVVETVDTIRTVRLPESKRGIRPMIQEFRNSIMENREPRMSGVESLRDVAVALMARQSVQQEREVPLVLTLPAL